MTISRWGSGWAALAAATFLVGCGKQPATRGPSAGMEERSAAVRPGIAAATLERRRAELLNRIREADPRQETVERALINERNELGLILSRKTNLDDVPKLLKAMLAQMDRTFPGEDHVAMAYGPTNPPRIIGTARLDARTRDMTYTPANPQ